MLLIQKSQSGRGWNKERSVKVMRFKRVKALVLAMAVAFTSVAGATAVLGTVQVAEASTGLAMNGNTIHGYPFSNSNFPVYNRTDGSKRKIGTCYGGSDWIIIHGVGIDGWSEIEYPISGGRTKRGYCLSSYLFANPDFSGDTGLVRSNITTYRKANCSVKYGTSTKNDNVFITGYSNGNTQILYKCTGYYKVAWIRGTYSVSNGYLVNGSGGNSNTNNASTYSVSGNLLTVNGVALTEYRIGSRYTSSRYATVNGKSVDMYGWQCCGFARYVAQKLYGCHDKNAPSKFRDVSGTVSAGNLNANKLKSLVTSAGVGAHVRTGGRNHSMVIIGVTNNNFTIVDANSDGKNTIRVKTYTWSEYMNCTYGKRGLLYIKKYVG